MGARGPRLVRASSGVGPGEALLVQAGVLSVGHRWHWGGEGKAGVSGSRGLSTEAKEGGHKEGQTS